jgi:hypothetical protein
MKMKACLSIISLSLIVGALYGQEFDKQIANAKSAYEAGNFEDSRFAVQNAMHELDVQIGKEVIAILPAKVNNLTFNPSADQITGSGEAYVGLFIERSWGETSGNNLSFSLISDSPLIKTVNTFLSLPMMMSGDSNQKKVKVEGYKAMLEKNVDDNSKTTGYSLMLPYSSALIQLNYAGDITEEDFMKMVNQIPVAKIIGIAQ